MEQMEKFSRKALRENFVNYLNIAQPFKPFCIENVFVEHILQQERRNKNKLKQDTHKP